MYDNMQTIIHFYMYNLVYINSYIYIYCLHIIYFLYIVCNMISYDIIFTMIENQLSRKKYEFLRTSDPVT
jgi:hypothetical protein